MKNVDKFKRLIILNSPIISLLLLIIISSTFSINLKIFNNISKATTTYNYIGNITHYLFNPLIAFPNTFKKNNLNNKENLTCNDFKSILNKLYKDNFILINLNQITPKNIQDNKIKLTLPQNKKPLLLSFKNLDYSNKNKGFIEKFIIDRNNKISTYTKQEYIHERVSYSNDFIPILEEFILSNPDFSYKNARANLIVNGSNGFLGYEIQHTSEHYKHELRELSKVTKRLKKLGYHLIYGGYNNNINLSNTSLENIKKDFDFYKKHLSKICEKNNYLFTNKENIKHFNTMLKQNFITIIEDIDFVTLKENNLIIITAKPITQKNKGLILD